MNLLLSLLAWFRRKSGEVNVSRRRLEPGILLATALLAGTLWWFNDRLTLAWKATLWALPALVFCAYLVWCTFAGPIFTSDLFRGFRRGRSILVRCAYIIVLTLLLISVYWHWARQYEDRAIPVKDMPDFAEAIFAIFMAGQFVLVMLLTPALVAGAVAEEKERRTLDFLLATDLRGHEIVLGKLAARLTTLCLFLLAGFPILCLIALLGGIDPGLLLAGFAVTGITLCSLASLSILCSVHARSARSAILWTYLAALVFLALPSLSLWALIDVAPHFDDLKQLPSFALTAGDDPLTVQGLVEWSNAGNIVFVWVKLSDELSSGAKLAEVLPGLLYNYVLFHGLIAFGCAMAAAARLRAVGVKQRAAASRSRRFGSPWLPRPPVGPWPMLWKETFAGGSTLLWRSGRLILLGVAVVAILLTAQALNDLPRYQMLWERYVKEALREMSPFVACLLLLSVLVRASQSIRREHDRQTLDSLLCTPLSTRGIFFAKWAGAILGTAGFWVFLALMWGLAWLLGMVSLWVFLIFFLVWLVYAGCFTAIGLWFSVVCRTGPRALCAALLSAVGLSVGHWLLWLGYGPFLAFVNNPERSANDLFRFHTALTPPLVLFWLAYGDSLDIRILDFDFKDFAGIAGLGISCWILLAVILWAATVMRFRALTGRTSKRRPEVTVTGALSETAIPKLLRASQKRSRRRRRLVLGGAALLLVALPVGLYLYLTWKVDRDLCVAVAELDATDPRWRFADILADRKEIPPERNSVERILAAGMLLPKSWPPYDSIDNHPSVDMAVNRLPPEVQMDQQLLQRLRTELQQLESARNMARSVAKFPEGRHEFKLSASKGIIPPRISELRNVVTLLRLDATLRAQEGDTEGALVSIRAALNVSRSLRDEPTCFGLLLRIVTRDITLLCLERVLAQGQPTDADLKEVQALLEDDAATQTFRAIVRSERAYEHHEMELLENDPKKVQEVQHFLEGKHWSKLSLDKVMKRSHSYRLRYYTRALDIAALPIQDQIAEMEKLDERLTTEVQWLPEFQVAYLTRVSQADVRSQAFLRCAVVAVAAERFRRARGRWPQPLAELVKAGFLREVPIDPFDGEPLRSRQLDNGMIIYSVGVDGEDNGGTLNRKDPTAKSCDLGFQLWDVNRRRQPAAVLRE